MHKAIQIRGARVHNLNNLDVDLPRNKLIVITGVSGSGKSSLAFDTLYAEGQRRYVESLSAYARQFLERMDRPDVDEIRGISPAVAIEQKNPIRNSRSTVGTATEIHDYLRLLFARIGRTYCPSCDHEIKSDQVQDAVDRILSLPAGTKIQIAFPLQDIAEPHFVLVDLKKRGFRRLLIDGKIMGIDELSSDYVKEKEAFVVIDRLQARKSQMSRIADSLDVAFREGGGKVEIFVENMGSLRFTQAFECARCARSFIKPQPRLFSFNNPFGACPTCRGFGEVIEIDMDLVIPDKSKSLRQGAIVPWNTDRRRNQRANLERAATRHGIDMDAPWHELSEEHQNLVIHGEPGFAGINGFFKRLTEKQYKIGVRVLLSRYRGFIACPDCNKSRLRPEALYVRIEGMDIGKITGLSTQEAYDFFCDLPLTDFEEDVAHQILKELKARLEYLVEVGLGYLTLNRRTQTLSGGEYQRINLATAVGFKLVGSLYVLDEPSIGLHPRDNERLIRILLALRDLGNTVVVVEHDRDMMQVGDQLLDLGPHAGEDGGEIVYQGDFKTLSQNGAATLTAQYLKGEQRIPLPEKRRAGSGAYLSIRNARENNLKNLDVRLPLGLLLVVTGVSGSGKSTLVHDVLYAGLARYLGTWQKRVGEHDRIEGIEHIDDIRLVDQSPIGRTPRSNPVTYTKAFDGIRQLFAQTQQARIRGYTPGAFSFNTAGGRCDRCEGSGSEKVEMQFLADLFLQCEVCGGKRYQRDVLEICYKGKNIYQVLDLTVSEALHFFSDIPKIANRLKILDQVGLGYVRLGQPATTLSGGEAQRIKLASHLAEKPGRHQLYLFDEPTTGLHFHDIAKLLACFNRLIEVGNSVLVIEHNMDVIKCADYVIDLGPEGGEEGGYVVSNGTPEQIARCKRSYTGHYLRPYLRTKYIDS
ncbi:excinuclease ABC subunit UvrA [bacterium]|nr:excinuclease ABC subunit UvrA [bacterium]